MAQNMYRVGDYVFFEISNSAPYQIRKIEELNKTATGNVEARVVCFYRRRDIPPALLKIADQSERRFDEYYETDKQPSTFQPEQGHAVANGAKTEEEGPSGEQSNGNANHDGAENASSSEGTVEPKKIKEEPDESSSGDWGVGGLPLGADQLSTEKRHMLRQKELFLSRQVETLPATHIRGKCMVTLLSEVETPESYDREDAFFYSLVYDPQQQTLLADKGAIRVGEKHQAVVSEWDDETGQELPIPDKKPKKEVEDNGDEKMEDDDADNKENGGLCIDDDDVVEEKVGEEKKGALGGTEMLVYQPTHSLSDRDIDQFLIIARAVGTFSRALDTSSSMKLPSLHMTAAAASRDVTLLHAMAILHQANYDMGQAVKFLVPPPSKQHYPLDADKTTGNNTVSLGGPILCRDQMEEWSASEANLFEEAIEKYGKDFNDVHHDFLPWKSMRDIVEYYYMWKTTNRYVDQKKAKNAEQESKLKQVYIPNYNKPNPNLVAAPTGTPIKSVVPCESCQSAESSSWYVWGPAQAEMRLCGECWIGWKKGGGLRRKHEFEKYDIDVADGKNNTTITMMIQKNALPRVAGGALVGGRCGQVVARLPADHPAHAAAGLAAAIAGAANSKARVSFHLQATLPTRIARRLAPKSLLNLRKSARRPALSINQPAIKTHCMSLDAAEVLKCAKAVCGSRPIQPQFLSALASGTLWQQAGSSGTPKRPLSANGMEPPAKKPAFA